MVVGMVVMVRARSARRRMGERNMDLGLCVVKKMGAKRWGRAAIL